MYMRPAAIIDSLLLVTLGCGSKYVSPLVFDVTDIVFCVHAGILTCLATLIVVGTCPLVVSSLSIGATGFTRPPMI